MSYASLFTFLGLIAVVSPLLLTVILGVSSLINWKLAEETISKLVFMSIVSGLIAATLVLILMLTTGTRHVAIVVGDWVAIPHLYHFSIKFVFDRLSVPFAILSYVLSGTIAAFATKYMHREGGFNRFFVFTPCLCSVWRSPHLPEPSRPCSQAGSSSDCHRHSWWRFFTSDPPARNGLWVWIIYRVSDASLLLASVVIHHLSGEGDFDTFWEQAYGPMRSRSQRRDRHWWSGYYW